MAAKPLITVSLVLQRGNLMDLASQVMWSQVESTSEKAILYIYIYIVLQQYVLMRDSCIQFLCTV